MIPRYMEKEERLSDAASVMDPLFFDGLRLEFLPIAEAILRSIITNSLHPIYIAKLSTESSLQLDWGLVWLPRLPPPPAVVWLGVVARSCWDSGMRPPCSAVFRVFSSCGGVNAIPQSMDTDSIHRSLHILIDTRSCHPSRGEKSLDKLGQAHG